MEQTTSQTLERELEDIRRKKQECQMLEDRLVQEQLNMAHSSSSPISINTTGQVQQHRLSVSPGNAYEIASFSGPQPHRSSASARRATVGMTPRSQSNMGVAGLSARSDTNMARSRSSNPAVSHPMSRSVSQTSNLSRASNSHATGSSLFPGTNTGMMDGLHENEQPSTQHLGVRSRHSASRLPEVQEDPLPNFGQSPMDFIMSTEDEESAFAPASFPGVYYTPAQTTDYFQYNVLTSISSSTPSLVSVDSAAAPEATPLTRDNSFVGENFLGGLELERQNSSSLPIARTASHDPFGRDLLLTSGGKQLTTDSAYPLNLGTNLSGLPSQNYPDLQSAEMYRSTSNTSTRSTASNQERRAKEARERQIQNSIRNNNIQPKPSSDSLEEDEGEDGSKPTHLTPHAPKKDTRLAAAKGQYQRPKHPKVFCDKCMDHSDGFRGEHELRRHVSSKHSDTVVKWICREPSIPTSVVAINPLSKCKACLGQKQYGAYYNAAAHLRRTHFRKRAPRARKAVDGQRRAEEHEKRAGKGGGDWPPMADLKHWMRRVSVRDGVVIKEKEPATFSREVGLMTYGNGGDVDFSGLNVAASYPPMLPELTVDTVDGPPAEGLMGGEASPFSSVASLSPLQGSLGFDEAGEDFGSQMVSPGVPYMEFPPIEEYGMLGGV